MSSTPETRQEIADLLVKLDEQINTLRVEFEQFFAGVIKFQPEKLKAQVEREFRQILKTPLKSAEQNFRARALKYRYNTLDSYWRRVLREKEEGRYHKDLFKANLKKANSDKEKRSKTKEGAFENQLMGIYNVYKKCLADSGQESSAVTFDAFRTVLTQRANSLKKSNPGKKVQFSLVVKNGLPSVEAKIKEAN